jgi:hypothetical protein
VEDNIPELLAKKWLLLNKTRFFSRNELVPIVMGARPEDYARSAPYKSYIHVEGNWTPPQISKK